MPAAGMTCLWLISTTITHGCVLPNVPQNVEVQIECLTPETIAPQIAKEFTEFLADTGFGS